MYIHDILFKAGVHPVKTINTLNNEEIDKLYEAMISNLKSAYEMNGCAYEKDFFGHRGKYSLDKFLVGYNNEFLTSLPSVSEYFSLAIRLLIAFGVIFEMPVLMVFLAKAGLVSVSFLNKHRKYAILINFIIAAILTPTPDIVNQMMMGIPLLVLYEVSVLSVWFFGRKTFSGFTDQVE